MRLTIWAGLWVILLDQASKYYVVHWLGLGNPGRGKIEVFPPYLEFHMAWNRGVNFGLFSGLDMRWVLIGLAFVISAAVLWWLRKHGGSKWVYLSAGLLIGGAMGNVIDRIFYGAVADFLNMSCCGINNPYSFNIADIAIFIGAVGLAFFGDDGKSTPNKNSA
ncbi:signal peptidase II [Yoonia tamlensis]|uniref:Lipoprotein signal peptidase n=1 Tax=Yoonia tamlensis TaxID=390270 RepID=A0A1I6HNB0_9RHOB|nr:signal peptidase II [Yoonia tamlensis]SFR55922.1 signal peptidase II [Yoonia tamlensis]